MTNWHLAAPESRRARARRGEKQPDPHLQGQIDQGVARGLDPELMAQAFLGMFFSYAVAGELLGGPAAFEQSTDEIISQFVDIFVKGTLQV